jgi:two-component system chemotaxis response regulator CheB
MPLNAIQCVTVDYILPVGGIAETIKQLAEQPARQRRGAPMPDEAEKEREIVKKDIRQFETGGDSRLASVLTCPECGGVMWELGNGELISIVATSDILYPRKACSTCRPKGLKSPSIRSLEERRRPAQAHGRAMPRARQRLFGA